MNLDCHKCTEQVKEFRGCYGKPKQPFIFDGKELDRCPLKLLTPETYFYISMHNYFEKGFLPYSGTILQQPAKMLDAFNVIDKHKERLEKDAQRKRN